MTRIDGPVLTHRVPPYGWLRTPMLPTSMCAVGDRLVPSPIEVDFPGGIDGHPALYMLIEVIDGVPRCTELTIKRTGDGREVRTKDLRAVELDSFVERFVSLVSGGPIKVISEYEISADVPLGEDAVRRGMKTIRDVRKGSRRPLSEERKRRVADVYNAHDTGGIEAVERAFDVSRSTAIRYIRAARDVGLIERRQS